LDENGNSTTGNADPQEIVVAVMETKHEAGQAQLPLVNCFVP